MGVLSTGMLEHLKDQDLEKYLILSEAAKKNIQIETSYTVEQVSSLADHVFNNNELTAPLASGSFITEGMVIIPCTIKTLSGIANSYTSSLMVRAADVTLKEKRKLVLIVRETPLHKGHLRLMAAAADLGAHILPPIPSFYHQPKTIDDIIDQTLGKILDYLGITHNLFKKWGFSNCCTNCVGRLNKTWT